MMEKTFQLFRSDCFTLREKSIPLLSENQEKFKEMNSPELNYWNEKSKLVLMTISK